MALFEVIQTTEKPDTQDVEQMTFKMAVAEDVDDIFFDITEHADIHVVDGKEAPVIIEEDKLQEHTSHWENGAKQNFDTGLYESHWIMYIKAADYGPKPKVGKQLVLDDGTKQRRIFKILQCREEAGIFRMIMQRIRQ